MFGRNRRIEQSLLVEDRESGKFSFFCFIMRIICVLLEHGADLDAKGGR